MISELLAGLLLAQLLMGATDSFIHHELLERLPWRKSQAQELQLHGVRNIIYGLVFVILAWCQLHGLWAVALLAMLGMEILVTLIDFVEEDRTRKLPASERVLHTLLALNYGAILALLVPVLAVSAGSTTSIEFVDQGWISRLLSIAAAAVFMMGIKDLNMAKKMNNATEVPPADLAKGLSGTRRILVTGGTGFIGERLVNALSEAGHHLTVLTRGINSDVQVKSGVRWITRLDQIGNDEPFDALINLAGEPIAGGLWTKNKREKIVASRVGTTSALIDLIERLDERPEVLVSGSAVGWYGLQGDEKLTEEDDGNACFSREICVAWEAEANRAADLGVRVINLRTGLVFDREGGMLSPLLPVFDWCLGARLGNGKQWMSWIHRDDMVRIIVEAIANRDLDGPINATAPSPSTNREFTRELANALGRPAFLFAPAFALKLVGGQMAEELLLGGQRVLPEKMLNHGFQFWHPTLPGALKKIVGASGS